MKKLIAYTFLTTFFIILGFKGYTNYKSWPKHPVNIEKMKEKNELDIFFGRKPWAVPEYSTSYELTNKTSKRDWKKR